MTPGWLADLVWILSGGRVTRETEHYILHELPFPRALCYLHAYWFRQPHVWTTGLDNAVSGEVARKVERILAQVFPDQP